MAGQQFEYAFDDIGNRNSTRGGGDSNGAALRSATCTANRLNQYSSRTVPSAVDVLGVAKATASVTVNSSAPYERGEYFHKEVSVSNGSGPAYPAITVTATEGSSSNQTGNILVPPATQSFSYDADGNLTNDSVWFYTWDGENRLTQMTNFTMVPTAARKKLVFGYDYLGRRITKKVYPWASTDYSTTPESDLKFVYDGWNLVAELNATNNAPIRSYLWGQDLTRTMHGAAGIGGLLMLTQHFPTHANHAAGYDGNGNVIGLINAANSTLSARYEYSSFGETIRQSGSVAQINPFSFSTKFVDRESSLVYYGYRFYDPSRGCWASRDPSWEKGGLNLYAFVGNQPTGGIDALGLEPIKHHPATMQLANSLPDGPGTEYLKKFTIPVEAPHYYDSAHRAYNPAVQDFFDSWLAANNITRSDFAKSEKYAQQFVNDILNQPKNTTIGAFNKAASIGGKILKAAVILGALSAGYSAYASSPELIDSWHSYHRSIMEGDQAMMDLDAVGAAIAVQDMTGDYFTTQYVLDSLLQ